MAPFSIYPEVTRVDHHSPDAANAGFIEGELYECDLRTIERLDVLENNGSHYQRELIPVRNTLPGSQNSFQQFTAWIYLWLLEPAPLVEPTTLENELSQEPQTVYRWHLPNSRNG